MTGRAADATAVVALEEAAMGPEAWSATQVAEELAAPGRVVRVARRGAEEPSEQPSQDLGQDLSGWVDLAVAGDVADLLRVAVHPAVRRRGLAGRLLGDGLAGLPVGVERVVLEVAEHNVAARGLYTSYGFVEVARRRRYYRDGADALVMVRPVQDDRGGDA